MGETLLKTDDLHNLKEGEIFTDSETGKKYRVKKTILPHYASAGPFGDPDDRTLRRIEADVIIPNRMNSVIEKVECNEQYMDLIRCFRNDGAVRGLRSCKDVLAVFNKCKAEKFRDPDFRERITEEYLNERREARRTGKTAKERKLEEFREWKRRNSAE
ncbi:COX assembly mitochondrial -like protein [Toxocara canis]|uniref:COX assembly mitochondrial protein n=1 Tax=Toxocara canis TaxID=6265 RepID=A0A0B2VGY7_TOXCA|nr:COX assembly mitochondrial -like protein [Toxocara canis]